MQTAEAISKREFWIFYYKFRLRLIMAFAVPFLIFFLISFIPTPRYKADSILIVRLGSEYVYQPELGGSQAGGPNPSIPFERDEIFKSEVAILNSDDLHKAVIKSIGVENIYPDIVHPKGFSALMGSVHGAIDKFLSKIGLGDDEPLTPEQQENRRVLAAVEAFDRRFDIFLEKESAVIDVSFEHKDDEVAVKALNTLLNLYMEKRKALYLEPRVERAEAEMEATRDRALAAAHAVEEYKRSHKLYSLEDQRSTLLDQRGELEKLANSITSPSLQKRLAEYNTQLDKLDQQGHEYENLQREATIANDSYSSYSHKLDEARAYENLQRDRAGSVRVIQPPVTPPEPKKLQPLITLAGLLISILCVLGVAAITEFSRNGFLTPERVQTTLDLPVLAVFPLRNS